MNRSVAQIVSRTGLSKGDKLGLTHGWHLETRNRRTLIRWSNRYQDADGTQRSITKIVDALARHGYSVSVNGSTIEVTQRTTSTKETAQ